MSDAGIQIFNMQQKNRHLDTVLQQKELSLNNSFQQVLFNKLNVFKKEVLERLYSNSENVELQKASLEFIKHSFKSQYSYNFS